MNKQFSILIINYNSAKYLVDLLVFWADNLGFLPSAKIPDYEILICENASPNQKEELEIITKAIKKIPENKVKIEVFASEINLGFGGANNFLAKKAKGKFIFFLNADTLAKPEILIKINQAFEDDNDLMALSPTLLLEDNSSKQKYAYGKFPNMKSIILQKNKSSNDKQNFSKNLINEKIFCDWISGAAMIIDRICFEMIGGFDEKYFMYYEDIDLCKRLKQEFPKRKIAIANDISLVHLGGKSLKISKLRYKYYFNAQNYYLKKYNAHWKVLLFRIVRFPYYLFRVFGN